MNVGRKLLLIVVASVALVTLPAAGAIYYYVKQDLLKKEADVLVAETKSLVSTNTSNLIKAEFSLKSLSRSLVKSLAGPPEPGEIAAFNGLIQHDIDGAWRSRRNNFDGEFEAGMFFPADAPFDIEQKILHLRSKRIMDVLAGSISAPFSNLWLLTPGRTEVIYDRGVKDFVMQMAADTDYTKTPWMMLGDPATNPDRVMHWTPPLFDPVPKSWMVSAVLPVDVNGHWIGNIGHDLYLKDVFSAMFQPSQHYAEVQHFLLDTHSNYIQAGPWQQELEAKPENFKPNLSNEPDLAKLLRTKLSIQPYVFENEVLFQGRKYLAIGIILPHVDWQYFQLVPIDQILAPLHQSFYILMMMVLVIGMLIGLLINFAVKRNIIERLHVLVSAVRSYDLGDLSARASLTGDDEITATSREFNVMADQLKQSLIELKDSEFRWKFAIESSGDVLWDSNEIDQTVVFSKGWKELTGFADDEINQIKEWENLIHPNDKVKTLASMRDCLDGKTLIYMSEYRSLCKDGSYKWIFDRGVIVSRNENGNPLRMIGISSDITARKVDEDKLRIAAIAFESQEGKLISNANNIILQVNKAFTEITGYDAKDVIGKTPRILSSGRQDKQFYTLMWESLNTTGVWKGEVWNKRKNGEIYSEFLTITAVKNNDGMVMNYVATLTDNTKTHAATAKIDELAFYDTLTKLPNRQLLLDRLNQALASRKQSGNEGALMFIDLDDFKTLNDTLGHDVGDLLLIQCAARISSCIREGDTVARLGGDEFVVLLENLSTHALEAAAQAETIAENIITALNVPYMLNGFECQNTASIGVVQFDNQNDSQETLFKHADIALYQAKRSGRNRWCFFDPHMQDAISARVDLVGELRKAIDLQQFQLHYQIQVDSTDHAVGAEVLIRWNHPKRGMVSPFDFIPLAEETGLILPIGQWVLEAACAQLAIWQNDVLTCNLTLAVNVSAKQFRQVDFVAKVQKVLNDSAIDPTKLKLELTESLLVDNIQEIVITMVVLKALGIKFSLDDFGTGYSSLQYLKKLPLDQLKIDQSFVRDLVDDSSDKAIVLTVITMAKSLGLDVIAEGVETEDQRQFLLENGCLSYQGYLFSKPVPLQSFEALLKQYS